VQIFAPSRSEKTDSAYLAPLVIAGVLLAVIYAPIVPSMVAQWNDDPNYSHGFLIPLISGWFLWRDRKALAELTPSPHWSGIPLLLFGMLLLVVGYAGTEYFTMRSSLIVIVAGIVLYWFGREIFKSAALPIGYLFFMVPLPYILYDSVAFPLKLFITKSSVWILKNLGVVIWREGNIIILPQTVLEVADACSGLRSLVSLLALGVAYAFTSELTSTKRLILIFSTLPIAIATNMFRVVMTGYLAQHYGAAAAEGFFHEFAGLAVFALGMLLLALVGTVMQRVGR